MAVTINQGDQGSFFDQQSNASTPDDLISAQVDPTQPQVQGLASVTDALVADQRVLDRLSNFDPDLYDLTSQSHLMRLLRALLGAAGTGGLRRQQTINRMTSSLSGTNFLDLDGFWGGLFGASRMTDEQPPVPDGQVFDPASQAYDLATWEAIHSRDGKYRSRITSLARAFAEGATYMGVRAAAEAILGCEVDLIESWVFADLRVGSSNSTNPNTYFVVRSQYGTYGGMVGVPWSVLEGGVLSTGDVPLGNRGEAVLTPKRLISEEERLQVIKVCQALAPAGCIVTVQNEPIVSATPVQPRYVYSDSNDWSITSSVQQYQALTTLDTPIYPNQGSNDAARPAFGAYTGERWSYNARIANATSYQMLADQQVTFTEDEQTVTFNDGTQQTYTSIDAVLDPKQVALARLSSEGVMSSYAYPEGRFS